MRGTGTTTRLLTLVWTLLVWNQFVLHAVPQSSPVARGWVFKCPTNSRMDRIFVVGVECPVERAVSAPWAVQPLTGGCKGPCEVQRMGRDLTATHPLPPTLSQSNPVPSSLTGVFSSLWSRREPFLTLPALMVQNHLFLFSPKPFQSRAAHLRLQQHNCQHQPCRPRA